MMRKLSVFLFVLLLVPTLINAQERAILRANGELIKGSISEALIDGNEVKAIDKTQMKAAKDFFSDHNDLTDTDVILFYDRDDASGTANFGQFGQDRMIQWFEAPADMIIRRAGANTYANPDLASASLKLVKLNWTKDQILPIGVKRLGWYEAAGNGFNDICAYQDDPDNTGGWVSFEDNAPTSPFGEDIWSDGGFGAPFTPLETGTGFYNAYEWFDMNLLFEPEVLQGDIIGVSVKNESADMGQVNDRIGFMAYTGIVPGFKFYANGRLVIGGVGVGDPGWWSREYAWDFALDVTLTGDQAPTITQVTTLRTTVDQGDRTVSANIVDTNPSGGPTGVDAANLWYSINGGDYTAVAMTNTEDDTYEAAIPGQTPGTEVSYYVDATDVEGNTAETLPVTYSIYLPTEGVNALMITNGWGDSGYPVTYYFGARNRSGDWRFDNGMDVWAFGPVETALLENYDYVYEFYNGGGIDYHRDAVRTWMAAKEGRGYFLAGMEWLGNDNNFTDQDYEPGSFEYDILGIAHSYNDITYDGATGQNDPSNVFPVEGTLFGDLLLANITPGEQLQADPFFEIPMANWMDAFDAVGKAGQVQITVETRGIDSAPDVQILPAGIINEPSGNKVVFLTFDPITLNTDPDGDHGDNYTWHGYAEYNFPFQAAVWFGQDFVSDIRELETIPTKFELSQNYPNPFNPSTTIRFQVPQNESVSLKVFDVLGREVATLLNDNLSSGTYEVNFDASNLAAGMYVYRLQAGDFVSAKKMMLLK